MSDYTSPATYQRMVALEKQINEVLNRANRDSMPLDLACFAMARRLLALLRMMPPESQAMMTALCCEFLEQRVDDSAKQANPLLVM